MAIITRKRALIIVTALLLVVLAAGGWLYFVKGYMGVRPRHAVPADLMNSVQVPGMGSIRLVADPALAKHMSFRDALSGSGLTKAKFKNSDINILAISGGGANGAYGAGILCGWSEAGTRPQFDIVTGVSTGALIAPAAFLGPSYDHVVREIYTNITDADIAKRNFYDFLFEGRPSLLDTQPLRAVLRHAVTMDVLNGVADAYAKGRRLYIATTNLDARRLVIWDMGAIASRRTTGALDLFRTVMLASASIPVAFPPVMITVEANGKLYDEMHVDGSVTTQIVGGLLVLDYDEVKERKTNVFVIRNGKIADPPEEVPYKVWNIASAAFSTLMTWQSYGDIYKFLTLSRYGRINCYFTCIPYEFNEPRKGEFDLSYMRKLFYRGYKISLAGGKWMKRAGDSLVETKFTK